MNRRVIPSAGLMALFRHLVREEAELDPHGPYSRIYVEMEKLRDLAIKHNRSVGLNTLYYCHCIRCGANLSDRNFSSFGDLCVRCNKELDGEHLNQLYRLNTKNGHPE